MPTAMNPYSTEPASDSPLSTADQPSFLRDATSGRVVRRALCYAVVVGTILVTINHGRCVVSGHFNVTCAWQSGLTVLVPYIVSTLSSVQALRQCTRRDSTTSQE